MKLKKPPKTDPEYPDITDCHKIYLNHNGSDKRYFKSGLMIVLSYSNNKYHKNI